VIAISAQEPRSATDSANDNRTNLTILPRQGIASAIPEAMRPFTRSGRRQRGLLVYDDPGEAAYAYGVSIVVGQVTWNDADMPQ
jgi:hypothetical protein